jgi:hypothetical protein
MEIIMNISRSFLPVQEEKKQAIFSNPMNFFLLSLEWEERTLFNLSVIQEELISSFSKDR